MKNLGYKILSISLTLIIIVIVIAYSPKNNPAFDPCPAGAVMAFCGTTAPGGYLLCDGSAVSRTTYDHLFAAIGTTYGSGDGSTTFNLPDLRQRFPLGKAASGTGNTLGSTGGAIDHTHNIAHTHSIDPPSTTSTAASATTNNISLIGAGTAGSGTHTHDVDIAAFTSGAASTSTSGTGNPPYVVVNYIIKF